MNIHEYQAKELLAKSGIAVPAGFPALSVEEAVAAAKQLPGPLWVVKAQIHAGGRGKGKFKELPADAKGGVRLAFSLDEVEAHAREMLGNTLVTIQTGDAGKQVNRLYVTDGVDIAREYYLSMVVDRASGRVAMIVSTEGGMDIETVAHDTPELISTITVSVGRVICDWQYASARLMSVPPPSWVPNSTSTGSSSWSVRSTTAVSKTTSRVSIDRMEASTAPNTDA